MKTQHSNRMAKAKTQQKETGDGGDKAPGRKQPVHKNTLKKGGAQHDDDDSVDSRGNIRGLIVSESEEDSGSEPESDDSSLTPEQRTEIRRVARKAAVKARERIQKRLKKEEDDSRKSRERRAAGQPSKKKGSTKKKSAPVEVEESESEEPEDESEELEDDSDELEDDDDENEYEDDDDEEYGEGGPTEISINIGEFLGGGDAFAERMKPQRHNIKKESDMVKKFFKLVIR